MNPITKFFEEFAGLINPKPTDPRVYEGRPIVYSDIEGTFYYWQSGRLLFTPTDDKGLAGELRMIGDDSGVLLTTVYNISTSSTLVYAAKRPGCEFLGHDQNGVACSWKLNGAAEQDPTLDSSFSNEAVAATPHFMPTSLDCLEGTDPVLLECEPLLILDANNQVLFYGSCEVEYRKLIDVRPIAFLRIVGETAPANFSLFATLEDEELAIGFVNPGDLYVGYDQSDAEVKWYTNHWAEKTLLDLEIHPS